MAWKKSYLAEARFGAPPRSARSGLTVVIHYASSEGSRVRFDPVDEERR